MADGQSAWGIEIGQAGLKALKLRYIEAANQVVAVAFDYVPHPKLLSQPDAIPDELIKQALETFLSRNQLGSDLVSISLPGQTALAKFIQLPPVEASRVKEIVKYEARQQIPFALEEVIWDFQPLGAGAEESGFLLDAEVGLFAMKREQVQHHMKPFLDKKVEVELVQIAPLALYNFLCYDRLGHRLGDGHEASDDYSVVVDMGCDNTALIVTNGKKIWIRNMPVGGNHFTRALTKEMKLTFAKAEHLKCNATKSPDPRAVFQALRPVFNDYVAEIQRSIGFFSSVNRSAKITRLIGVGNGFRLAGLQKFLQQNLQYEVERIDNFKGIAGDHVLNAPLFQENLLTFCVPYGLAIQALKQTDIRTTLLPPEIATARLIRRKKPWATAAAATLLAGLATSAAGYGNTLQSVSTTRFGPAEAEATAIESEANSLKGKYTTEEGKNKTLRASGDKLVGSKDSREYWLEVYKAIDECLPRDIGAQKDASDIKLMNRISVQSITCKKYDDLGQWYKQVTAVEQYKLDMVEEDQKKPPTGTGYVFTLNCVHYHEEAGQAGQLRGVNYVRETLLKNLKSWSVAHPNESGGPPIQTLVRGIGISHATITYSPPPGTVNYYPGGKPNPAGASGAPRPGFGGIAPTPGQFPPGGGAGGRPVLGDAPVAAAPIPIPQQIFTIQFAWVPTPTEKRQAPPAPPQTPANNPQTPSGAPASSGPPASIPAPSPSPSSRPTTLPPGGGGFPTPAAGHGG